MKKENERNFLIEEVVVIGRHDENSMKIQFSNGLKSIAPESSLIPASRLRYGKPKDETTFLPRAGGWRERNYNDFENCLILAPAPEEEKSEWDQLIDECPMAGYFDNRDQELAAIQEWFKRFIELIRNMPRGES